jgi:hypothetical protein
VLGKRSHRLGERRRIVMADSSDETPADPSIGGESAQEFYAPPSAPDPTHPFGPNTRVLWSPAVPRHGANGFGNAAYSVKVSGNGNHSQLANVNAHGTTTPLLGVIRSDSTRLEMRHGTHLIEKLQTACAAVLDQTELATQEKKRVLESLASALHDALMAGKSARPTPRAPRASSSTLPLVEPTLPKGPPNGWLWKNDRKEGETPADYILRVYGPWLANGMTMKQLRERDIVLVSALYRWRKHNELPKDLRDKLPTVKQRNDRVLAAYARILSPAVDADSLNRELGRLGAASLRRRN